jgi:DNA-binding CsgD family transcriptional regulator
VNVNLNLSPEDFAALARKAEELGVDSIEEVVRRLALAKPEPKPSLDWLQDREPWSPQAHRSRRRCSICSRPGHYASRCPKRGADNPPKRRACSNCGQHGHNVATCRSEPVPRQSRPAPPPPPTPEEIKDRFTKELDVRYPGMFPRLGHDSDLEIAIDYGISRQRVHQIRNRLGIDAANVPYSFTEEGIALLGTMSDVDLAERLGTYKMRVQQERRKHDIPAFEPVNERERKIEQFRDLVGVLSDPKVAKLAGVPHQAIFNYRQKYGIETKVISPKHKDFVRIDYDEIARLFHEGKTDKEIAEAVGGTAGTITGIRNRLRLVRKEAGKPVSDDEKEVITRLRTEGHSLSEIARRLNRPHATVASVLRRAKG